MAGPGSVPCEEGDLAGLHLLTLVEDGGQGTGDRAGALVVRVGPRAVDGQATAAALAAVAAAFGVPRKSVRLVSGAASRTKIVDVPGGDPAVLDRLLAR